MAGGAIILCGGKSSRMGRDKALLPFGPGEAMLQRVVRLVAEVVRPDRIVCVAAAEQELSRLAAAVRIVVDPTPHQGPLAGIAAGLAQLQDKASAAFVTGCDVPLLAPALIERMFDLLDDHEIAAPHDGQHWHPLVAVYRVDLLPRIESLLSADKCSVVSLLESSDTRRVTTDELLDVDSELLSLATCNAPSDYARLLTRAGITTSE